MLQRFTDFILQQHLLSPGQEVLLAVSGGRDSVCMAHLFHRAAIPFAVAHCNFHLRPGDCDRDQALVRRMAGDFGVPFFTADFDTLAVADATGRSIEEAARHLRYSFFDDHCRSHGFAAVATAHHRDDSVETFFLNLFRGTGISGLHGIRPRSRLGSLAVVRPMLCFSRADIDAYVQTHALPFADDYTNALLDAQRNRIRLRLMPLLRELYPSVDATMAANLERFAQAGEVYGRAVDDLSRRLRRSGRSPFCFGFHSFVLADLLALEPLPTLLFELLRPYGFSSAVAAEVAEVLRRPRTGSLFLSATHAAAIDRPRLLVVERDFAVSPTLSTATASVPPAPSARERDALCLQECVDADSLHLPLSLRPWQPGDRFFPLGMDHPRRLSDFLKDCKINVFEKRCVHVAIDADGRIVWVVGLRLDNRFRVTPSTSRLLVLKASYK